MIELQKKYIDALRKIDKEECAELPAWLTFPLWDRCLIEPGRVLGTNERYVLTKMGKLFLAAHPEATK